jgi:hypothetical protein
MPKSKLRGGAKAHNKRVTHRNNTIRGLKRKAQAEYQEMFEKTMETLIIMRTKIVSAFPGVGKTTYHKNNPKTTLDSDSSGFSWIVNENGEKVRNSEFPQNYINHIKENIGKYKYIFVSSHKEVRDALLDNCLFFYLVYPDDERKDEFIQRYRDRGNDENFIKLVDSKWDEWMREFYWIDRGCEKLTAYDDWNLDTVLEAQSRRDGGD